MGTPGYVAPEQAISSTALTAACDIYALGVVLFELLCGRLPFEADTAMGIVLKHLYDPPPPPTSVRPELPPAVDAVVLRALEKEPTARFGSAGELAQALAAAWPLGVHPGHAPAPVDIHSQLPACGRARLHPRPGPHLLLHRRALQLRPSRLRPLPFRLARLHLDSHGRSYRSWGPYCSACSSAALC
jgi:serine/threonine-protein kinase